MTRTPLGSKSAANWASVGRGRAVAIEVSGSPISTRASTAIGIPSDRTIKGLTSILAMSERSLANLPRPTKTSTNFSRSTAASPRNSPRSFCVARSAIISCAVTRSSGAGRKTTSAIASAKIPPIPSMTLAPNCGSRTTPAINSRFPCTIGATKTVTGPSSGRAAASRSAAASCTA
ncbi:unannotated protein [freshwater metagenome]|uniref:Unannotated protein n=1 Tax=freshwater metagenome TaxID=449393 RepID=A0A6J7DQ03_9ZZZZ